MSTGTEIQIGKHLKVARTMSLGALEGLASFAIIWLIQWLATKAFGRDIVLSNIEEDVLGSVGTKLILPCLGAVLGAMRPAILTIIRRAAGVLLPALGALLLGYILSYFRLADIASALIETGSIVMSSIVIVAAGLIAAFLLVVQVGRAMARYDPLEQVETWTLAGPLMKEELESQPEVFDLSEELDKWRNVYSDQEMESDQRNE